MSDKDYVRVRNGLWHGKSESLGPMEDGSYCDKMINYGEMGKPPRPTGARGGQDFKYHGSVKGIDED